MSAVVQEAVDADVLNTVLSYYENGLSIIPLRPRSKIPLAPSLPSILEGEWRVSRDEIVEFFKDKTRDDIGGCWFSF